MRLLRHIFVASALASFAFAGSLPDQPLKSLCATGVTGAPPCSASKHDLKEAKSAFERGLKLQNNKRLDEALEQFDKAAELVPQDVNFATARELAKQQLIYDHVQRGNNALVAGNQVLALGEFRTAASLDPENEFARQRLLDALGDSLPKTRTPARVVAAAGEIRVSPLPKKLDFHFRGDTRELLSRIAQLYGLSVIFDDSVISRQVRFDVQDVGFYTAAGLACQVTKTFWTALDEKQILFATESPDAHKQYDRMALRTFYIPTSGAAQELNDVVNALRSLFGITFVNQQSASGMVTIRAPEQVLDSATEFIEGLDSSHPQVLLDVRVYQISQTLTRNVGLKIPNQFQLFNIPAGALAALGGQNIQDLINQLISGGGINQANSTALSGLLAQLQNQQNSIFSQPLATFGNGLTFFGVSLGTASATLQMNESSVKNLENATLRAAEGKESKLTIGTRFPILNASFAPVFNTAAISRVIGNNSFQAPFPSFSYEDLGFTMKAKPLIHGDSDISLDVEFQIRSLGGASLNGVPIINNREYKGSITLKNGEPAVVAGSVSRSEQKTLGGIPGFGEIPLLNKVTATNTKEDDVDELLVVITPHVLNSGNSNAGPEIWLSTAK